MGVIPRLLWQYAFFATLSNLTWNRKFFESYAVGIKFRFYEVTWSCRTGLMGRENSWQRPPLPDKTLGASFCDLFCWPSSELSYYHRGQPTECIKTLSTEYVPDSDVSKTKSAIQLKSVLPVLQKLTLFIFRTQSKTTCVSISFLVESHRLKFTHNTTWLLQILNVSL